MLQHLIMSSSLSSSALDARVQAALSALDAAARPVDPDELADAAADKSAALSASRKRSRIDALVDKYSGDAVDADEDAGAEQNPLARYRPWSAADHFARVQTFRLATWYGKPSTISPLQCARFGWCNDGVDKLVCRCCNASLVAPSFACLAPDVSVSLCHQLPVTRHSHRRALSCHSTSLQAAASLARSFSAKLSSSHTPDCPWSSAGRDVSTAVVASPILFALPHIQPGPATTAAVSQVVSALAAVLGAASPPVHISAAAVDDIVTTAAALASAFHTPTSEPAVSFDVLAALQASLPHPHGLTALGSPRGAGAGAAAAAAASAGTPESRLRSALSHAANATAVIAWCGWTYNAGNAATSTSGSATDSASKKRRRASTVSEPHLYCKYCRSTVPIARVLHLSSGEPAIGDDAGAAAASARSPRGSISSAASAGSSKLSGAVRSAMDAATRAARVFATAGSGGDDGAGAGSGAGADGAALADAASPDASNTGFNPLKQHQWYCPYVRPSIALSAALREAVLSARRRGAASNSANSSGGAGGGAGSRGVQAAEVAASLAALSTATVGAADLDHISRLFITFAESGHANGGAAQQRLGAADVQRQPLLQQLEAAEAAERGGDGSESGAAPSVYIPAWLLTALCVAAAATP